MGFIFAISYFIIFFGLVTLMLESIIKLANHIVIDRKFEINYLLKWSGFLALGIFLLALVTILYSVLLV